jgi:hypothetical protein
MASILALMATIFSIKRRPVVFRPDGKLVDQQFNVSLWSRYSFQWCTDVLSAAGKEKFGNEDVPAVDHIVRSENATERFYNIVIKDSIPLWVQIFWAFRSQLILQWLSILFSNFFDVAPAFATLQLLKYLETRTHPNAIEAGSWRYVVSPNFIEHYAIFCVGSRVSSSSTASGTFCSRKYLNEVCLL